jgi:uncharacterized RDD family membrane protein YckC
MEAVTSDAATLQALIERRFDGLYEDLKNEERGRAVRWGGFFRRCSAFVVDIFILCFFSFLLFYLSSLGLRVGLAAHQRALSWENAQGVLPAFVGAWLLLVCGYFVVLHGLDGRTVGKWLFGLRVVGANQEPIGYGRALIRWMIALLTAPLLLGFLRILWHREKRGWHDSLARTWVIREPSAEGEQGAD